MTSKETTWARIFCCKILALWAMVAVAGLSALACSKSCQYQPIVTPDSGTSTSTGTATATGTLTSTFTSTAVATGSATMTETDAPTNTATGTSTGPCKVVTYPSKQAPFAIGKQVPHHKLTGRHYRQPGRARATAPVATGCSSWNMPNSRTPANQVDGSCTGHMGVALISTYPYLGTTHFNEPDALAAYQGGTCIDNGCAIPCTCASCPRAYCPATHAHDVGSLGSSVLQWMIQQGWLKGYTTADTTSQLIACLDHSGAGIGIDYYNSMWDTNSKTGELQVDLASGMVGGHEPLAVSYDALNARVWIWNSWGNWGWCFPEQETVDTPSNGTGCGYAWIAVSNLPKLKFDGDCPEL